GVTEPEPRYPRTGPKAGALYSIVAPAQSMAVAKRTPLSNSSLPPDGLHGSVVTFAATRRLPSRAILLKPHFASNHGLAVEVYPTASTLSRRGKTRPRFRRCIVPQHHL